MSFFYKKVKYLLTTHTLDLMPDDDLSEVAIVGRSNVGKSSLINLLANQRQMAYTSSKPGKTRGISFFDVQEDELHFRLVDLPGYGFANVSKSQKLMFAQMMDAYFTKRTNLEMVIILIDIRRSFGADDYTMIEFLVAQGIKFKILGTKVDKTNQSERSKFERDCQEYFGHKPLMVSALKRKNIEKIKLFFAP